MNFLIGSRKVSQRLGILIGMALAVAITQATIGLYELSITKNSLKVVYEDQMSAIQMLDSIGINMLKNRTHLNAVLSEAQITIGDDKKATMTLNPARALEEAQYIEERIAIISKTWDTYVSLGLSPEEKVLADTFAASRKQFVLQLLKPSVVQLRDNNYQELQKLNANSRALFVAAEKDLESLTNYQLNVAKQTYERAAAQYEQTRLLTFGGLAFAILILCWLGFAITRSITKALGGEPETIYDTAKRIAAGDLDFTVSLAANDSNSAMAAMNNMQSNIKLLVKDAAMLAQAAQAGKLTARSDASQHQGDFRKVVSGVNDTLDALTGPLSMAANYVDNLSKGVIPAEIIVSYNGDFNIIKNNLNACGHAIKALVEDAKLLASSTESGNLTTRADAGKHLGEYSQVVQGLNATLDAIIKPLNMAASNLESIAKGQIPSQITEHYNGDFNAIKNNLNASINALTLLVTDTAMLVQAAQNNQLDKRADATKHWGDYRKIVEGVNGTLDTVMQQTAADAAEKAQESQALSDAVEETQHIIEGAKAGDLSQRVSLDGKIGAIASLCDGVNALMDKMTEVIVQVKEAGETINTAASEIATGNNDLSSRTEQQASSLEETASSMEQLSSAVKQNAENAKQANQLAAAASNVAIRGGTAVSEVVNTMAAITTSSRKIEAIISVIDGIAFQTNILALNAAVEAARAGEQGRGFAVVAGEVRNLAQRSAGAAKEIKELISDSVGKVQEGTKLVEDAGKTMEEIVSSVQRVTDIMGEISAASSEQSAGINQVNNAITSMDEVTQQNAALVEQAAAAAESLVEQAVSLMDTVGEFKLQGMGGNSNHNKMLMRPSTKSMPSRPVLSSQTPIRAVAKSQSTMAKTGTNDENWEEF